MWFSDGISKLAPTTAPVAPPIFAVPFGDLRVVGGTPLKLECRVNGEPLPELTWFKDGEKVEPSDRIQIEAFPDGTARLFIPSSTLDDDGIYRCVAKNPSGTANIKASIAVKRK